jgi:hypothetical protein
MTYIKEKETWSRKNGDTDRYNAAGGFAADTEYVQRACAVRLLDGNADRKL